MVQQQPEIIMAGVPFHYFTWNQAMHYVHATLTEHPQRGQLAVAMLTVNDHVNGVGAKYDRVAA